MNLRHLKLIEDRNERSEFILEECKKLYVSGIDNGINNYTSAYISTPNSNNIYLTTARSDVGESNIRGITSNVTILDEVNPEISNGIIDYDISSMYPRIIRTPNIDPEEERSLRFGQTSEVRQRQMMRDANDIYGTLDSVATMDLMRSLYSRTNESINDTMSRILSDYGDIDD